MVHRLNLPPIYVLVKMVYLVALSKHVDVFQILITTASVKIIVAMKYQLFLLLVNVNLIRTLTHMQYTKQLSMKKSVKH